MEKNEQQLLERVRFSDMEAFKILFEEFQPILFRYVLYRLRDEDLTHDIVQETFVRVWQHRSSLKPHLAFLPYLMRISGNLIRDYAKHARVHAQHYSDLPKPSPSLGDNPEHAVRFQLLEREIIRVVNTQLPDRCRSIFLLSRMEGKSNAEIATLLDVRVKTVENQLNRALKVLRRELREYL